MWSTTIKFLRGQKYPHSGCFRSFSRVIIDYFYGNNIVSNLVIGFYLGLGNHTSNFYKLVRSSEKISSFCTSVQGFISKSEILNECMSSEYLYIHDFSDLGTSRYIFVSYISWVESSKSQLNSRSQSLWQRLKCHVQDRVWTNLHAKK